MGEEFRIDVSFRDVVDAIISGKEDGAAMLIRAAAGTMHDAGTATQIIIPLIMEAHAKGREEGGRHIPQHIIKAETIASERERTVRIIEEVFHHLKLTYDSHAAVEHPNLESLKMSVDTSRIVLDNVKNIVLNKRVGLNGVRE